MPTRILLNDDYVIRLVASDGRSLWYEPAVVSVSGNLKHGEFHLEFTDLAVPVAGIPITVTRVYDTRQANQTNDFGYGWSLGVQDAKIRKTLRNGTMFLGSRVYLNTPDGRRVGFTANYQPASWLFSWIGYVILQPDAGVYEKLEIEGNTVIYSGGSFYDGLGDASYNPSTFRLTTKDGTVYTYNDTLGLQNVRDLNGNQLVLNRDGVWHFSAGSSTPDQSVPFIRDAQGRISEIIDPAGKRLTYAYDARGDLRSFTDQVTNVTQYLYSTARAHYLTNIIDPLGHNALRLEYDSAGRLVGVRDALGNLTSQEFPDPNTTVFKDANGHTNIVRYDDNGNEVMKAIPGISTNTFAFDANNNEIWRQDARGFVTTRAYDSRGNMTNIVDALSNVTAIAFNDLNKPTSVTDALGHTTQSRYDSQGRLTNVINALGGQAFFTRDTNGRLTGVTDFNGHTTLFDYTGGCSCGKASRVINPDGSFRTYEYNARGQVIRETDEFGYSKWSYYDDAGRLLWVRDAESNVTRYAYSGSLKISETDPLGRTIWYAYDGANRQIAITNATGGVVRFEYDNGTNRTAVIDPVGNVTRSYYDAGNRLSLQVDPWGRTNFFAYDAAGNRTEAIDRNGRRCTFAYDGLDRRTHEYWWEGANLLRTLEYSFSAVGALTVASDPSSQLALDYDSLNRLTRITQTGIPILANFTLSYAYDHTTNVVSVTDNWGVQVASAFDARNRLTQRVWQGGGLLGASVHFDSDAAGNRTNVVRFADATGTVLAGQSRYGFSPVGLITNILHTSATGATLAEYRYQRNAAQGITQRILGGQTADYRYDLTGQLTNALYSTGQPNEGYHYDANGNRVGAGYIVTTNNQIVADGTNIYRYDLEGSLEGRSNTVTHATTAYSYDHRNRLMSVVDKDAGGTVTQTVEFTYDALNRRIAKSVNGTVTHFLLNQEDIWADANGAGDVTARYLLGNRIDEVLARSRPGEAPVWYLTDNLGSVGDLVDSGGTIVNHITYDSFGRVLAQLAPASGDRVLFTGREYDLETGLLFYRARYYSPDVGRFTSQDPVGFDARDYNLYRYVFNNPVAASDPSGELSGYALTLIVITEIATIATEITVIACVHEGASVKKIVWTGAAVFIGVWAALATATGGWYVLGAFGTGTTGGIANCVN